MIAFTRNRSPRLKIVPYRHHSFRWKIAGYYVNGKRVRRLFATRDDANVFLNELRVKRENLGNRATAIDPKLHVMAIECSEQLKAYGQTIQGATEFFIRHAEATKRSCTVEELTEAVLTAKRADGKSKVYLKEMKSIFKRFNEAFAGRIVAEINAAEIDDWLRAIPLEPLTRNNYRRVASMLFSYAVVRRYCSDNPVIQTAKARVKAKPVGVLTPEQTQCLLECADPTLRPALAIGAFAGLRDAEIARLSWSEIHLDRGFIEVTASKSKTASRRLVTIQANLKAWLERRTKSTGLVNPPNRRRLFAAARLVAGLRKWPKNGLRHSFASYQVAYFQDASALALQMGHTTTGMLFAHYREVVTPESANAYWLIVPRAQVDENIG